MSSAKSCLQPPTSISTDQPTPCLLLLVPFRQTISDSFLDPVELDVEHMYRDGSGIMCRGPSIITANGTTRVFGSFRREVVRPVNLVGNHVAGW